MGDVDVVDLLVAVERLVQTHRAELDALNVFPVPDADTGRNVLATVRGARAAAEQADAAEQRSAAVRGALLEARGNAGTLTSQLLRGLLEELPDAAGPAWAARLDRADELARAAVAHPVEGSFLTAVRAAARAAAAGHDDDEALLRAAVDAAHAAVRDTPTQLEVLARAGVVDSGARAAALVLEALAAHLQGVDPSPPAVEVPPDGPDVAGCEPDEARYEVMYLLDPSGAHAVDGVRAALGRVGTSVVVVAADRLVSVHVHTDDIGAAVDAGLAHGRPHHVRVEDLHEGVRRAAAGRAHPAGGDPAPVRTGIVVGADGGGVARLAAATGATTLALPGRGSPTTTEVRAAISRTGRERVVLLPADPGLAVLASVVAVDGVDLVVVGEVDTAPRLLAALAVLDPTDVDVAALADVAAAVRCGSVVGGDGTWRAVVADAELAATSPLEALEALLGLLAADEEPEVLSLLLGRGVGVGMRDAAAGLVHRLWPDVEVDVLDVDLGRAVFAVGVE